MAKKADKMPRILMPLSHWLTTFVLLFGIAGSLYLWRIEQQTQVSVYVPIRDLPPYHQIQHTDLVEQHCAKRELALGVFTKVSDIIGRYTLDTIPKYTPLSKTHLSPVVDTALLSNTVAIAVEGDPALALGGQLRASNVVNIWDRSNLILNEVLVLDVKMIKSCTETEMISRYVIILAIPVASQSDILLGDANGKLSLTLAISAP